MRMSWRSAEDHAANLRCDLAEAGIEGVSVDVETERTKGGTGSEVVSGFRVIGPDGKYLKVGPLDAVSVYVGAFIAGANFADARALCMKT